MKVEIAGHRFRQGGDRDAHIDSSFASGMKYA